MLICIDGTGDSYFKTGSWTREDIRRSYVHKVFERSPENSQNKIYIGGPDVLGLQSYKLFRQAMAFYESRTVVRGQMVSLVGYSRGAYICICLANALQHKGTPVRFLGLFDAVSRQDLANVDYGSETEVIPGNVQRCVHARRNPSVGSRTFFGNAGLAAAPSVDFHTQMFSATHSGMGGMPWEGDQPDGHWPSVERNESRRAGYWMAHHLTKQNIIHGSLV